MAFLGTSQVSAQWVVPHTTTHGHNVQHTTTHNDYVRHQGHVDVVPHTTTHVDRVQHTQTHFDHVTPHGNHPIATQPYQTQRYRSARPSIQRDAVVQQGYVQPSYPRGQCIQQQGYVQQGYPQQQTAYPSQGQTHTDYVPPPQRTPIIGNVVDTSTRCLIRRRMLMPSLTLRLTSTAAITEPVDGSGSPAACCWATNASDRNGIRPAALHPVVRLVQSS